MLWGRCGPAQISGKHSVWSRDQERPWLVENSKLTLITPDQAQQKRGKDNKCNEMTHLWRGTLNICRTTVQIKMLFPK